MANLDKNIFKINNSLFSFGGVIGRFNFLINAILIHLFFPGLILIIALAIVLPGFDIALLMFKGPFRFAELFAALTIGKILLGISIVGIGAIVYVIFNYTNIFKRMRDIRGTVKDELLWQIIVVVFSLIPYVCVAFWIYMLLKKGVVTHPNGAIPVEKIVQERNVHTMAEELKKLDDLKKKRLITKAEFDEAKQKLLKRL